MRLTDAEWAAVYDALLNAARSAELSASVLGSATPKDRRLSRFLMRDAVRKRALAMKLGDKGEVAAYLGVRPTRKRARYDASGDPRRAYMGPCQAADLIRRWFLPRPGSWDEDADARVEAELFVGWCAGRAVRPDAAALARYMAQVARWSIRTEVAATAGGGM